MSKLSDFEAFEEVTQTKEEKVSSKYKVPSEEDVGSATTALDAKKHLKVEILFQNMFLSINLMILCLSWLILSKKHLVGRLRLQRWKCCMFWSFLWLWEPFSKLMVCLPVLLGLTTDSDSVQLWNNRLSNTSQNFYNGLLNSLVQILGPTTPNQSWKVSIISGVGHSDSSKRNEACVASSLFRIFSEEKSLVRHVGAYSFIPRMWEFKHKQSPTYFTVVPRAVSTIRKLLMDCWGKTFASAGNL